VNHQTDIFLDWAEGVGILDKVNQELNDGMNLKPEFRLESGRRYTNEEITERRMQSMFGADHDLGWFRRHGVVAWERSVAERYPRGVVKLPRVPVYFPHIPDRGRELRQVLDELKLDWDLSLYTAVPDWPGCWSHRTRQPHQLFGVNYKLPFLTSTTTQGNPWLMDLARRHPYAHYVGLNTRTARGLGIADRDEVEIEGSNGYKARGFVRVTETVHPDVAAIASCFGHWAQGQPISYGKGVHYNAFIPLGMQGMEMLSADYDLCALLTIRKVGNGRGRN
jgi:molybdopterin-containing oxidoreductase family molybdopterin binding subunit